MLILVITLSIIYGWMSLFYGETNHIGAISFLIIGFLVSGIIFRILKRSIQKFCNNEGEGKTTISICFDITLNFFNLVGNGMIIVLIIYLLSTVPFYVYGGIFLKQGIFKCLKFLIIPSLVDTIMILWTKKSSKKKLIQCVFAVIFIESFVMHFVILILAFGFIIINFALAWILLFVVISLIFLN